MEINEKLETRLNRVLDSRIEKAKGSQNEESESESASQKLKETFSKRDDSSNLNEENGKIEDLLSSSQSSKKETCNGRKPSLGLSDEKQGADTTSENTDNRTRLEAYQERQAQMKEDGEKIARQIKDGVSGPLSDSDFTNGKFSINSDNVVETLDAYERLTEDNLDKETLTEAICDEVLSGDYLKRKGLDKISNSLQTRAEGLGLDTADLQDGYDKAMKDKLGGYVSSGRIDEIDSVFDSYSQRIKAAEAQKLEELKQDKYSGVDLETDRSLSNLDKILEENGKVAFSDAVKATVSSDKDADKFFSNGEFDNDSVQQTGNCWLHAGVFALKASEAGTQKLNNLVSKENGVTTINIPEERAKGDSSGLHSFSEFEIYDNRQNHSNGDGDMTALSMAVKDYTGSVVGDTDTRAFELFSGHKTKYFSDGEIPQNVGATNDINRNLYENMQEHLNNGTGAFTTSFKRIPETVIAVNSNYSRTSEEPALSLNHAYAVRRIDDDFIYLQESNKPSVYLKIPKSEYLKSAEDCGSYVF